MDFIATITYFELLYRLVHVIVFNQTLHNLCVQNKVTFSK